ncbi:sensor histidine kinase [Microbacterium sp. NIBRBAC000506063]|uniref:sensor histidine kinase n=1 Tax=Microbacterium sp. NIBRBAC000506063 TaxID=2734618 RepID=UPI001CB6CF6A|nr:histidine kinase [Microbacterium sp. NIBRBAC000506063]
MGLGARLLARVGVGGAGALVAAVYLTGGNSLLGGFGLDIVATVLLAVIAALVLGVVWLSGMVWRSVLRSRGIREAQVRAERATAEEQERVRIARDMHDIVAHSLAVVIAQADGARYAAASDPEAATEALATISQTSRAALSDVRMLLTQLRHRQGDGPQPTLADLETLFAQVRQAGIEPRVTIDPMPAVEPPGAIQLAIYRILQEALTNALRHGTGDVDVQLAWWPERVDLVVRNATGDETSAAPAGHGLIGMRERAQLVGGTLQVENVDGVFTVQASLPIAGPAA